MTSARVDDWREVLRGEVEAELKKGATAAPFF